MVSIIIADDEPITRQGLSMLPWEEEGFVLSGLVSNGVEALDLIRSCRSDILLTDIRMPGMNGLELMECARHEHPQLKVIFITAYHQLEYALKAIQLGASGFVLKPTDPDEIMNECRKVKESIDSERERKKAAKDIEERLKEYQYILESKVKADASSNSVSSVIVDILREMETRYMEDLTLQLFSQRYHFHPDYLTRLFKKETGDNFVNVLVRIRMQQAVHLLADASIKIYEIAERVGIRDSRYFGQLFKKHYGVTPHEFRKRLHSGQDETEES
ncbi:response regulator [Paenibacillus doosanensis]|uniref:Response regulatory protein n=1 Tax=Paenibacillus konkukensis TaxID=2020716 RepID=A0ABY4REQ9_9BACL|nr:MULTISPECIES: response regulator [Paenibacillus]MCS7461345.1 response regulator [Paenibacillus doosanensis]UQZ81111.1 putative response regulatory protein [Paenibacillus konkukensis]